MDSVDGSEIQRSPLYIGRESHYRQFFPKHVINLMSICKTDLHGCSMVFRHLHSFLMRKIQLPWTLAILLWDFRFLKLLRILGFRRQGRLESG